jgi:hypothetical protein
MQIKFEFWFFFSGREKNRKTVALRRKFMEYFNVFEWIFVVVARSLAVDDDEKLSKRRRREISLSSLVFGLEAESLSQTTFTTPQTFLSMSRDVSEQGEVRDKRSHSCPCSWAEKEAEPGKSWNNNCWPTLCRGESPIFISLMIFIQNLKFHPRSFLTVTIGPCPKRTCLATRTREACNHLDCRSSRLPHALWGNSEHYTEGKVP